MRASGSELSQQIRLAVPLAAQQLGFQLMGTVDAAMLGRYSKDALAAAGIGNSLLFAITSVGLGVVLGLDSVIPRAVGAQRPDEARQYLHAGVRIAVLVGLVAALLALAAPLMLALTDVDPAVATAARDYTYVRAIGAIPFTLSIAFRSFLAAHHVTRPLVVAVVAGNVLNAVLNAPLIFGVAAIGLPSLGPAGAALATVIVQILITAIYALSARRLIRGTPRVRSTRAQRREVLYHGLPIGGHLLAEVGIFAVATVLAGHIGTQSSAAHAIALSVSSFTFSCTVGIGSATAMRVGHAVGAGDIALARKRGLLGLLLGFAVMTCFAAVFVAIPGAIASVFTSDAAVIAAAIPLFQIAALFQLFDGAQGIGAGALRGIGRTHPVLVGNVVGHYVIGLPLMLSLAFGAGLGAPGLWWGLSAGLIVTATYLWATFVARTRTRSPR